MRFSYGVYSIFILGLIAGFLIFESLVPQVSALACTAGNLPATESCTIPAGASGNTVSLRDVSSTENVTNNVIISTDKPSYKVGDVGTLQIGDSNANLNAAINDKIQAQLKSTSDPVGIPVVLTETGPNTSNFTANFKITSSASSTVGNQLHAGSGDNVTISYLQVPVYAPRFQATFDNVGGAGNVTVSDLKLNPGDELNNGFNTVLEVANLTLSDGAQVSSTGDIFHIVMSYANANLWSACDLSKYPTLCKTGALTLWVSQPTSSPSHSFQEMATYAGNPTPPVPAPFVTNDPVAKTISFDVSQDGNNALDGSQSGSWLFVLAIDGFSPGSGGGTGGVPSTTIVLDYLAASVDAFESLDGFSAFGADYEVKHPPSIGNDYRNPYGGGIMINGKLFNIANYTTKIPQQVLAMGHPANFTFKVYDERGPNTVAHAGMYFHFKGDPAVINADTWISWDKYKGLAIYDPNKLFNKTSANATINGNYLDLAFSFTPQKPMPDSNLIMRMWDDKLVLGDVPIWGAIVIVDPNAPVPVKKITTDQYDDYVILEQILDKDGYKIPKLLNKLHNLPQVYSSLDINWVYDKGVDKLTMVESDKSGVILGTIVSSLSKKDSEPTLTDHNFFNFTTQQLNRQDESQEDKAKLEEEQKALKLLDTLGIIRQNNFESLK